MLRVDLGNLIPALWNRRLSIAGRDHPSSGTPGKRSRCDVGDRIDRFALRTAIMMVDTKSLVVAAHESRADQVGDRPADIASSGASYPLPDLHIDDACRLHLIGWEGVACRKRCRDFADDRSTTRIALARW